MRRTGTVIATLALAACASDGSTVSPPVSASRVTSSTTVTIATTPATVATTSTTVPVPQNTGGGSTLDEATRARITGVSWRPGCPVPIEDLRLLRVIFRGFDGADHQGELIVHARWAESIAAVFVRLHDLGYPIERISLIDDYGASDDASVLANNTSAFNCRAVTGGTGWSRHAYGTAIDINPRQNPYVYPDGHVFDPASEPYRNRDQNLPGMIHANDEVFNQFAALGWRWGGSFSDTPDPQHFDTNVR